MRSNIESRIETEKIRKLPALLGRFLISACVLVLMAMPITERCWHFDGFFSGGSDFEFGVLAFVVVLCLMLLLAFLGERRMSIRIALNRCLWLVLKWSSVPALHWCGSLVRSDRSYNFASIFSSQPVPLRV